MLGGGPPGLGSTHKNLDINKCMEPDGLHSQVTRQEAIGTN